MNKMAHGRGGTGLWMAAPGGDDEPGGVLLGRHAGGHPVGLQAQLVHPRKQDISPFLATLPLRNVANM